MIDSDDDDVYPQIISYLVMMVDKERDRLTVIKLQVQDAPHE